MRLTPIINKVFFFLVLSCTCLCSLTANSYTHLTDSLIQQLSHTKDQFEQVDLLNEISYAFRRNSPEKVLQYGQSAWKKAQELDYVQGAAIAKKNIGIGYYKTGAPADTTIAAYQDAIHLAEQVEDYYTQVACRNNIALIHRLRNKRYTAIQFYLDGIAIFDRHFKEDLRLKALMLANLGRCYDQLNENDKALRYTERAIKLARHNHYDSIISMYSNVYGRILTKLGRNEDAKIALLEGLHYSEKLEDQMSNITVQKELASLDFSLGQYHVALTKAQELLERSTQLKYGKITYELQILLMQINQKIRSYDKVIKIGKSIIQGGQKSDYIGLQQAAREIMLDAFEAQGQYHKAFTIGKAYHALNDSIRTVENTNYTSDLEAKYQSQEKKQAIDYLNREKEILDGYVKWLSVLSFVFAIAGLFIFFLLRKQRKADQIIKEQNTKLKDYIAYNLQLENFAYITSHDLKTPLRTMISFSQLLKRNVQHKLNEAEKEYLNFIIDGSKEMSTLIEDILEFSTIQNEQIELKSINLKDCIEQTIMLNQAYIQEKQAKIELAISNLTIEGDKSKLHQLFQNLILNGIKFHQPNVNPIIKISAQIREDLVEIQIKDNGIGIEKEFFDKIFLIFKRLNRKDQYNGSGMGLAICKKIADLHNGNIWVASEPKKGSTFHITLPYQQDQSSTSILVKNVLEPAL